MAAAKLIAPILKEAAHKPEIDISQIIKLAIDEVEKLTFCHL